MYLDNKKIKFYSYRIPLPNLVKTEEINANKFLHVRIREYNTSHQGIPNYGNTETSIVIKVFQP